ncbi:stage II sporulation protein D [Anaerobacillus sp. MEB173]|uniref:stage II sporulation protein D n=1 Tax=Anaerobacillus sp. MEB173 TaxID=3383345 RepID=UPI003F91C13B
MKPFVVIATILCSIILVIPSILVLAFSGDGKGSSEPVAVQQQNVVTTQAYEEILASNVDNDLTVTVFRSEREKLEEVPLEQYVMGVIASEMPANFEIEALKAQALTARTYIIRQMLNPGDINLPEGATVTDTVMHQVYHNKEELKELWGQDYEWKIARITEAVATTRGQILTYNNDPITATFFSTSNGYTENSEDYWQSQIPYLRSVESPWDKVSPKFNSEQVISVSDFERKLGVSLPSDGSIGKITGRTKGGRVSNVDINGVQFSGREIREKLELQSSDFSWSRNGDMVVINTKGWGHGVGMSQYGADGMAKEGKTYQEIVKHYYQGVEITTAEPYVAKINDDDKVVKAE